MNKTNISKITETTFYTKEPKTTDFEITRRQSISSNHSCQPQKNVAFLKVHKTGSSTMLNMFYRFASKYNLNLVLPKSNIGNFNYLGYGTTLNPKELVPLIAGESYNILCNHVVYNRQAFRAIMPRDTMYIGILREPVAHFMSAFSYYGGGCFMREQIKHLPLSEINLMKAFLQNPYKYSTSGTNYYLNNKMSFDFGLNQTDYGNSAAISEFISRLDEDFILVIILEYLDESLVLLKRILCWEMQDIIYIPVNVRFSRRSQRSKTAKLNKKDIKNLQKYNKADFLLYDFFKKRLLFQIQDADIDFQSELKQFRKIQSQVYVFCKKWLKRNLIIFESKWNSMFTISPVDCLNMMRDELNVVKETIDKANEKYFLWSHEEQTEY